MPSSASLPAILNVFGLWLVLFLVWAIFFLEVFSLVSQGMMTFFMRHTSFHPLTRAPHQHTVT